jgi:hypothetical protein
LGYELAQLGPSQLTGTTPKGARIEVHFCCDARVRFWRKADIDHLQKIIPFGGLFAGLAGIGLVAKGAWLLSMGKS